MIFLKFLDLMPRWSLLGAVVFFALAIGAKSIQLSKIQKNFLELQVENQNLKTSIAQNNEQAAIQSQELTNQVLKAQNEAQKRKQELRTIASAAAAESDGLRIDLDRQTNTITKLSTDAAIERAAAIANLLADCSREYQGLAEKADSHAADLKMMQDAWPRLDEALGD